MSGVETTKKDRVKEKDIGGKIRLKKPIFLLGCHKSGTSLLRSLLDGHRDLFVLPREAHFFPYAGYWVDYPLRRAWPRDSDKTTLIQSLKQLIDMQNTNTDPYGDAPGFGGYDVQRFVQFFENCQACTLREQFASYIRARYYALFGTYLPKSARIVEKSVENAEYAPVLRSMFPDSKFVHIVRNPYATLVSIRRSKSKGRYPYLARIVGSLYNSYYHLFKNVATLDRYLVIRYEDLVSEPRTTMQQVVEFLDISFVEDLLQPTRLGRPWHGNSVSNQSFQGISKAPLSNWKKQVHHLEVELVNRIAQPVLDKYGYERLEPARSRWRPMPGEGPRTYLKNRFLLPVYSKPTIGNVR